MAQSFKLYRLQQLDSHLDRTRARLEEVHQGLNDAHELHQAENQYKLAEVELQTMRKSLQKAEQAVKDQRIKIEMTEAALYGGKVRNPKELQDLQNESAALKRYLVILEDRQLEAMLNEEETQTNSLKVKAALELAQAKQAARQKELFNEQDHLQKDIPRLEEERQVVASTIPADEIGLYDALRRQRRGVAVSLVQNKACNSCGTTLSAKLLDATLTSGQLTRCDGCGRILYIG